MAKQKKIKYAQDGDLAAQNRRAKYDYHLLEKFEAGIVLNGHEVKSLRLGRAAMKDTFARVQEGELWLHGMTISSYESGIGRFKEGDERRPRKLLLHRREIKKITSKLEKPGTTLVATRCYFKSGRAKVEIALAEGKREHDKRHVVRERDAARELDRAKKHYMN